MPYVWPGSPAASVFRSLSSGNSHEIRKAKAATGAATKKTVWMASAYAWTTASWTLGESRLSRSGLSVSLLTPGGSAVGEAEPRVAVSRLVKIVPKMATPNEPPMERKNVAPEVATPRSW